MQAARRETLSLLVASKTCRLPWEATGLAAPRRPKLPPGPSDVGDLASLDFLFGEEKQGKGDHVLERTKALLGKQRDRLAREVQAGLSSFAKAKVSSVASPFRKKAA